MFVALAGTGACAAPAAATKVDLRLGDGRFTSDRIIVSGSVLQNEITVTAEDDRLLINDAEERIASDDCAKLTPHTVRCENEGYEVHARGKNGQDEITFVDVPDAGFGSLTMNGGDGDDRLRGGGAQEFLDGAAGRDVVIGAGDDDFIDGSAGADLLRGGGGDDSIGDVGEETGADRMFGGAGKDFLDARDERRDARIACGGGEDRVRVDRVDPEPVDCERVRRRAARLRR